MKKEKKPSVFQEFMDFVDKIVQGICTAFMLAMFLCVILQVASRYLFKQPFSWTEEIARWLLVWIAFLAASHVAKASSYISVTYFVDKMPPKLQNATRIFIKLALLFFAGFFAFKSFTVYTTIAINEVGPATQLPMMIPRSALFIGMALTFLQMLSAGGLKLESSEEAIEEDV